MTVGAGRPRSSVEPTSVGIHATVRQMLPVARKARQIREKEGTLRLEARYHTKSDLGGRFQNR